MRSSLWRSPARWAAFCFIIFIRLRSSWAMPAVLFLGAALSLLTVHANGAGLQHTFPGRGADLYLAGADPRYHAGHGDAIAARPADFPGRQGPYIASSGYSGVERAPCRLAALCDGDGGRGDRDIHQRIFLRSWSGDSAAGADRLYALYRLSGAGRGGVGGRQRRRATEKKFTVLLSTLTYKRRLLEVLLDMLVISSAFIWPLRCALSFTLTSFCSIYSSIRCRSSSWPPIRDFFFSVFIAALWRYTGVEDLCVSPRRSSAAPCFPWPAWFALPLRRLFTHRHDRLRLPVVLRRRRPPACRSACSLR